MLVAFQGAQDYRVNFVGERIYFVMGKAVESPCDFSDCLLNFAPLPRVFASIFQTDPTTI